MLLLLLAVVSDARQFEVPPYVCSSMAEEPQLTFDAELQDMTVPRGAEVMLKCSVYGAPQAAIAWYHRGKPVQMYDTPVLELALPNKLIGNGIVESSLRIPCADVKNAGDYVCVASTPCGQSITSEATLRVTKGSGKGTACAAKKNKENVPYITLSTVQRMEFSGNPVQLMCRAEGSPKPKIEWYKISEDDGELQELTDKGLYMTLSNGDLLLTGQDHSIVSESFRCMAMNRHGAAEADSTVIYMDE